MNKYNKQTIVLADDHWMVRQCLRSLLEREGFTILGEASNGYDAIRLTHQLNPTFTVLDIGMPMLNGIDAAREIHKQSPGALVVLLTMFDSDSYVLEALRAGIRGYVLKSQASADLVNALNEIKRGSMYLSPGISEWVIKAYLSKREESSELLTEREIQVLQLIAEGNTTKQIASLLDLSVKTGEFHRTRIMQKLDIHETAGLVRYAIRRGLIEA